jgi:hypothetical protein
VGHRRQGGRGYVVLGQQACLRSSNNSKLCLACSNKRSNSFAVQSSLPEVLHVECFIGQNEELDQIHQYNSSRRTAVVHGLDGIGKTELALAYARRRSRGGQMVAEQSPEQAMAVENRSHASWRLAPGMLSGLLLASSLAYVG